MTNLKPRTRINLLVASTLYTAFATGCGDEYVPESSGSGGAVASGGGDTQGGAVGAGATARGSASGVGAQSGASTGGVVAQSGASNGGVVAQSGASNGGVVAQSGASNGGVVAQAGAPAGGATTTGVGGAAVGAGGTAGKGGTSTQTGTGGTTTSGGSSCGTTPSTFSQQLAFPASSGALQLLTDGSPAATLKFGTSVASPAANPTLCSGNCAALSATFAASGTPGATDARVVQMFSVNTNLVGATLTASIAVDNPAAVPVQVQLLTGGDAAVGWAWGNSILLTGATLAPYAVASGFRDVSVLVTDKAKFCASATYYVALWLDTASTPTTAGTVTVYIKNITITPPGSTGGTGGATGASGATGISGASGSVGFAGSAGRAPGSAGTAGV